MPGVPSSKGCDACRRVKKKCDELKPCSRCRRLQILCIGSGQQRFKFKNTESGLTKMTQAEPRRTRAVISPATTVANSFQILMQIPGDKLAALFANTLANTDVRYDITYYGVFLKEIPRRLGHSVALDASVKAVVTAYPYFRHQNFGADAYMEYCNSLRALRESLNDPVQARSLDTLCAVYLISICQSWLGRYDDKLKSHGEAIAHLLKITDLRKCKSSFEKEMIVTLTVPVILEAVINPRIQMDSKWWDDVTRRFSGAPRPRNADPPQSSSTLSTFANLPEWIRHPDPHIPEIAAVYLTMRDDAEKMRRYLDRWSNVASNSFTDPAAVNHCRHQAGYTLVITLALILNTLLRAFDPTNTFLTAESLSFCSEMIREAEAACRYRPLGAAYVALCLVVGCSAAEDPHQLARLQALLADYSTDFKEIDWIERIMWLRACFYSHHLRAQLNLNSANYSEVDGRLLDTAWHEQNSRPESCSVM
ncbi:uncharacterized protein N7482_004829 [Penicillium canariense]|uniref:Zn(2)-C6 fungal-type domain-containing protein n=1 Tax=Penicillium canariense TaxID=189055 RepID=A0A9W9I9X9_9EURO|nr:uncharacterized protein N7482_004829 [Penicillium canariense]KAJ5169235.1 hypothetical protein N7482_004829 [Penicillium canariense]